MEKWANMYLALFQQYLMSVVVQLGTNKNVNYLFESHFFFCSFIARIIYTYQIDNESIIWNVLTNRNIF